MCGRLANLWLHAFSRKKGKMDKKLFSSTMVAMGTEMRWLEVKTSSRSNGYCSILPFVRFRAGSHSSHALLR